MTVTTVTCTGDRPEAFALCERYLARQTVKPAQMLVLDDGAVPTPCTLGQEYHHWPELSGRGSMVKKLRRAMNEGIIKGDAIVFAEDDDWISADYLEWCAAGLSKYALYGEGRALYYNVRNQFWFEHANMTHASLCATAVRRELFPWLKQQCEVSDEPFLDVRLWNRCPLSARVADPYADSSRRRRSVGIKAMPGRTGYGGGHRGRDRSAVSDPHLTKLHSLIGDDAESYRKFFDNSAPQPPPEKNGYIAKKPMINPIAKSEAGRVRGPNWWKWLDPIRGKQGIAGLEIGTFEGDSAQWMLDNVFTAPDSIYHCVDPFTGSVEHHKHGINVTRLEQTTREKLAKYPNVVIHKGYSEQVLRAFTGKLDFVYVDGSHTTRDVLRDAVLAFDLLNHRGCMIFDDYTWGEMPNEIDRPKLGIDSFLRCYAKQLRVLEPRGWQIAVIKIE